MCIDDFSVSHRTRLRWWILGRQWLSFHRRFLSQWWSICTNDFGINHKIGLCWRILGQQWLSFHQWFLSLQWPVCAGWWQVMWLPSANRLICDYLCVRCWDRDWTFDRLGHPMRKTGRWFPPFSCIMLMFRNDLVMDDMLLSYRWMLNQLWNVDWFVDEC